MMKDILRELRISLMATLLLGIVLCGIYPLLVWVLGQGLFPARVKRLRFWFATEPLWVRTFSARGLRIRSIFTPGRRLQDRAMMPQLRGAAILGPLRRSWWTESEGALWFIG